MRKIHPDLDVVLTELGATAEVKAMLVGFLVNEASSIAGQIAGLRSNAENATRQADELEPQAWALADMLDRLTDEVVEPPAEEPSTVTPGVE